MGELKFFLLKGILTQNFNIVHLANLFEKIKNFTFRL
jgi:hypothetical protein